VSQSGKQDEFTLDRIVLATDFSEASERAATYAKGLANRYLSSLSLTHVVDLSAAAPFRSSDETVPLEGMREASLTNQSRLLNQMTSAGVRTTVHTLEAEKPAASLVSFAKGLRADLIITGTNSRHGLKKVLPGSFAEGVIRHATCPVLTVGPMASAAASDSLSFGNIVYATNLGPDAARQAAVAMSFAADHSAHVTLCHVLEKPGKDVSETLALELKAEAELEKLIPAAKFPPSRFGDRRAECVVASGDVAKQILKVARERQADLIVLGAKSDEYWFTHLFEGTVGQVLMRAGCPVLTIRSR
jgi:nucleotide-binding universal stress UspA family protein